MATQKTKKDPVKRVGFGGAQEGAGRKKKDGDRTSFIISRRGRQILELSKVHQKKKSMTPALEEILEEYAQNHNLPVTIPKEGEEASGS